MKYKTVGIIDVNVAIKSHDSPVNRDVNSDSQSICCGLRGHVTQDG